MKNKIFWGFDAFEQGLKTDIFVAEVLASLNEKLNAEVYPVFALGSDIIDAGPEFTSVTTEGVTKIVEEKVGSVLDKVKIPGILPPKVVVNPSISTSKTVKSFVNHAEKNGATLIAVGSHGKKGFEKGLIGSFAETLLLQCHLPVLVVGQNFDQVPKWNEILFPTDFSDDSSYAFYRALDLAKTLSAKVTLFHHLSPILDPAIQSVMAPFGGVWIPYREQIESLKGKKQEILEEWVRNGEVLDVEVKTYLDTGTTDSASAILSYAKSHNIGLITMATESGPISTALFGAITRKVVRQAECPVWLLRRN